MGQKVHPTGYRLGVSTEWESKWFAAPKEYAKKLHEDLKLREYIMKRWQDPEKKWEDPGISRVDIERVGHVIRFTIWTSRPGVVIGKGGTGIQALKDELQKLSGAKVMVNVQEIKNADVVSQLVAKSVAASLERRISFRRAMKQAMFRTMKAGAKGIKIQVSGRLGGAEIARTEWYNEGRLPLSTIKADIDYGFAEAITMYGVIGCKVWIFRDRENERPVQQRQNRRPRG